MAEMRAFPDDYTEMKNSASDPDNRPLADTRSTLRSTTRLQLVRGGPQVELTSDRPSYPPQHPSRTVSRTDTRS